MSNVNLNPQLGGKLKALQKLWNHDTAAETLATVFDICVNRWGVTCPPNLTTESLKSLRVVLKPRHVAHFNQMAQMAGCTVSELARATLIQWLCAAELALLTPNLSLPPPPKSTKKPKRPLTVVEPSEPKFDAKASLLALKKN